MAEVKLPVVKKKKKRNEGKVDGEEDKVKSGIKRSFGPFLSPASARYR